MSEPMRSAEVFERFKSKYKKGPGCWIWTACKTPSGYGWFFINGKCQRAHRVSYEIHIGKIPKGLLVCHTCDNRLCVNPSHLFVGTHKDNMRDCIRKNRFVSNEANFLKFRHSPLRILKLPHGTEHHASKLNWKLVEEIRELYRNGKTISYIAVKYGIKWPSAESVCKYVTWKHPLQQTLERKV